MYWSSGVLGKFRTLAMGIVALFGAAGLYYEETRIQAWPRATGTVLSSAIVNANDPSLFEPQIRFEFDDRGIRRSLTATPALKSPSYDTVRAHVDRYPPGATVELAHDRTRDELRYEFGMTRRNLLGVGGLTLVGLIFTFFGVRGLQPRKIPEDAEARLKQEQTRLAKAKWQAAMVVVGGGALAGLGIWMLRTTDRSVRDWPTVYGEVITSGVTMGPRAVASSSRNTYDITVTFKYTVDGVEYVRQAVSGNRSSSTERATRRLDSYRPGSRHRISYRRDDPNVIQFDIWNKDPDVLPFGLMLAAVAVVGLGIVMWRKPDV